MTSLNQGLFSTTMEAEKRDPGNEVAISFDNGCRNGEVSQVKYSCSARGCFSSVKFALRI